MSPKKAKFLADSIKKMKPADAIDRLTFGKEKGFILFAKAIKSALSDSENNYKLDKNSLFFKSLEVGKGPHLKRWQPVARGMAHQIKKRMTHLKIVLEERDSKSQAPNSKQIQNTRFQKTKKTDV